MPANILSDKHEIVIIIPDLPGLSKTSVSLGYEIKALLEVNSILYNNIRVTR